MKKKLVLLFILSFWLSSCFIWEEVFVNSNEEEEKMVKIQDIQYISSWDSKKEKEINYHIDYPIFPNFILNNNIHFYFNSLVRAKKEELKLLDDNSWFIPEIHASFTEYEWAWIKSIVYEIFEYYWLEWEKEIIKIFYLNKDWKEIKNNDIFILNDESKTEIKDFLFRKLKDLLEDETVIYKGLDKYLEDMDFYIDWDKIIFLFEEDLFDWQILWLSFIKEDLLNFKKYINKDLWIFPEEIKRPEIEKLWKELENLDDYIIFEEIWAKNYKEEFPAWKKYIALTFDDWPSKANTVSLLNILEKHNAKATFFVLGKNASYFPDIIKQIDKAWHEIWSHSWNHPQLTRLTETSIKEQIENTDNIIYETIWKTPRLLRPPYWDTNELVNQIADRTILLWNVDSLDWKNKNVEKNIENIMKDVKEWSIILMHDIHKTTIETMDELISLLKDDWYEFLTVSQLLDHYQKWIYYWKTCSSWLNCN